MKLEKMNKKADFEIYLKINKFKSVKIKIDLYKNEEYLSGLQPFNEPKIQQLKKSKVESEFEIVDCYRNYQKFCLN